MAAVSAQTSLIWTGYYPMGDVYPLAPTWAELHTASGVGLDATVEPLIWQDFLVPYGLPWEATLDLVEMTLIDDLLLEDYTYVSASSYLARTFGWDSPISFVVTPVYSTGSVWSGKVVLSLDTTVQTLMGLDTAWRYQVRLITEKDGVQAPLYVAAGTVVVRR